MRKKLLKISAFLCCAVLTIGSFTACEENSDNPTDNFVYYRADGNIGAVGGIEAIDVALWLPEYNTALLSAFPNTGEENDDKAIDICDGIYNKHKASELFSKASGEITIYKYRGLSSDPDYEPKPEKTLKVYKYDGTK